MPKAAGATNCSLGSQSTTCPGVACIQPSSLCMWPVGSALLCPALTWTKAAYKYVPPCPPNIWGLAAMSFLHPGSEGPGPGVASILPMGGERPHTRWPSRASPATQGQGKPRPMSVKPSRELPPRASFCVPETGAAWGAGRSRKPPGPPACSSLRPCHPHTQPQFQSQSRPPVTALDQCFSNLLQ